MSAEVSEKSNTTQEVKTQEVRPQEVQPESNLWLTILSYVLVLLNVVVRVYCGLFLIISDCDETYNYWEPLNLIARGFGKQTWEYSPYYAIRSYVYLIPYYLVTSPLRDLTHLAGLPWPSYLQFYYIRLVALCGFTAFAEYKLFQSVRRNFSAHAANWFLLFSTFAPGMSHASVALLPSSFAMTWITWGTASVLDAIILEDTFDCIWPSVHAIFCFLVAGLVGWPFALAIGAPFGIFCLAYRFQKAPLARIVLYSVVPFCALLFVLIAVDSYFYDRVWLFVPFNIVLYNVFALEGEGPEIFGTEPFSYYVKNLLLNFNLIFILGYLGAVVNPALSFQKVRSLVGVSLPLLLWSFIFFRQPHKEERFLYPVYTLISLSAAVLVSRIFQHTRQVIKPRILTRIALVLFMIVFAIVSVLRILNLVNNYSAPITSAQIFYDVEQASPSTEIQNVCVGREWYHFPTSFFLPDNYRLRFVTSGFDGLLPGDFPENVTLQKAASAYPKGMNGKNIFSPDKLFKFDQCDFYIDNSLPTNPETGEPKIIESVDSEVVVHPDWELLSCEQIINPDGDHGAIAKLLFVPEFARTWIPYQVETMDYCVAQKRK